jgi:tRNA(Ile)-lysidine synthase TilS/MesJ
MLIRPVKADNKKFLTPVKKAMQKYRMLEAGDRIAVGLSGGKDSSTLFYILTLLQKQLPFEFELVPITLTLGFDNMDVSSLENYIKGLGSRLHVKATQIGKIVFDVRKEKNPCSLCANLRRGALYNTAKSLGCNKAALGHHLDDAIETLLMNLVFNGRLGVFLPKSYLDRRDITVIRPMIFLEEKTIENIVRARGIPVIENTCPANKNTKREEMKELVGELKLRYPDIRYKILHAIQNINPEDFWNQGL